MNERLLLLWLINLLLFALFYSSRVKIRHPRSSWAIDRSICRRMVRWKLEMNCLLFDNSFCLESNWRTINCKCVSANGGQRRQLGTVGWLVEIVSRFLGGFAEVFTELIYKIRRMHSYLDRGIKSNGTETTQSDIINNVGAGWHSR